MEVLTAVIIVGLTVSVFFQVLSSSMKLEFKSREKIRSTFLARQTFNELMRYDPTEEGFPWDGTIEERPWTLELYPVAVEPEQAPGPDEIKLRWSHELYAFVFTLYEDPERKTYERLTLYKTFEKNHFTDDFKSEHLSELPDDMQPENTQEEAES